MVHGETRQCEGCGEIKPSKTGFYQYPSKTGPRPRNVCIDCSIARMKAGYRANRPERMVKAKERYRKEIAANPQVNAARKLKAKLKQHGASMEWYQQLVKDQQGLCAICGKPESSRGTRKYFSVGVSRLAIDHDPHNNRVRGLLCMVCNNRLGVLECHDWLPRAMAYLAKHQPL